jgi:lipoyl(octanoyl) transferase
VYVVLNLRARGLTPHGFIDFLESWQLRALKHLGLTVEADREHVGIWVSGPLSRAQQKISSMGMRISQGVSSHGFAVNLDPNLEMFRAIHPCGLEGEVMTSLRAQGIQLSMKALADVLIETFEDSPIKVLHTPSIKVV